MKIVIDIDEISIKQLFDITNNGFDVPMGLENIMIKAFINGKPLPKNHGRLIDADVLKTSFPCGESVRTECVRATIDYASPIIEAESEEGEQTE